MTAFVLFASLAALLALGVPVAFSIGLATVSAMTAHGLPMVAIAQKALTGIDSFPLLALPFFLLAAELMSGGSLSEVLLRLARVLVGHRRGGLGHANVVALTFFSGISGSALADAAGPGAILIRMMKQSGYPAAYAAALTATTAVVGPIIPPSITMVVYALQDERVSVLSLFWAGVLPGLLISASLLAWNEWASRRRGFRSEGEAASWTTIGRATVRAVPALLLPVLIVGGIHGGAFTPTEASVVAVFYALLVGRFVYRTLAWSMLPSILSRSALMTAGLLLIVTMSSAFAWVLNMAQVPQAMSVWVGSLGLGPIGFLFAVNVFLLVFGIFIEPLPGVLILVPILAPMAAALGVDPIHFAIVVIVNLTLGMITPPVGTLLFVTGQAAGVSPGELNRELWPMLALQVVVLAAITLVPSLSTWLPAVMRGG
ncbi:MAG: sialic acid transporter permease protein SiaT [Pseudomonadota bacterium]|jgi:tripartite ATP-independent transporter DctM subunit